MQRAAPRPIPQRGAVKAMSFTAANRSEAMSVLRYYTNNTTPQELHTRIKIALSNQMLLSSDVENLLSALENIGVVTSSAHAAVKDNVPRHCLRCHQPYMERDNGLRSCIIPHIVQKPTGAELVVQAPKSVLIMGRHTTLAENVA
jgi:hypothetical protein